MLLLMGAPRPRDWSTGDDAAWRDAETGGKDEAWPRPQGTGSSVSEIRLTHRAVQRTMQGSSLPRLQVSCVGRKGLIQGSLSC